MLETQTMSSALRTLRASLAAGLLLALGISLAAAAGGASFGLRPVRYDPQRPLTQSYFIYDAQPGQTIHDEVRLTNTGSAPGSVRLYAVDGTTGQTSGTVFLGESDPRTGAGSWIALDQAEMTLAPGESRLVGFTVTIPAQVRPGQHLGGLVAQNTEITQGSSSGALQVNVQTRTITAVQINLPGPVVEHVSVTGVSAEEQGGYQMMVIRLRNDGTMMLKPVGTLTISDGRGQVVQTLPLQLDTVLPDSAIAYPVPVKDQALPPGQYHADLELRYGSQGLTQYGADVQVTAAETRQETKSEAAVQLPAPAAQAPETRPSSARASLPLPGARAVALLALALIEIGVGMTLWRRVALRRLSRRPLAHGIVEP